MKKDKEAAKLGEEFYRSLVMAGDKIKVKNSDLNDFYLVIKEFDDSIQVLVPKNNINACCRYRGEKRAYCVYRHNIVEVKGYFSERL